MDVSERWQRASESAERLSPFRRRQPILVALMTAFVALISLTVFLFVAGLDAGQFWGAALVSIIAMTLVATASRC